MVAVLTASGDPARLAAAATLRPDALLTKPVDPEVLARLCGSEVRAGDEASGGG